MKLAMFSTKGYDRTFFDLANEARDHEIAYLEMRLNPDSAALAEGFDAVCVFVNDQLDATVLSQLAEAGIRTIALRCAGFNNVDLAAAAEHGMSVVRVPEYSPYAVAEHTIGMMLSLNRHLHRAYNRVRDGDFRLSGLLGFDVHGKTVGVIGTGRIGRCVCKILTGFGCQILASDPYQHPDCLEMGVEYVSHDRLFAESAVIMLQCPLTQSTHHLIDAAAISKMPKGVMIINTSRGAVIDTRAVVEGLKSEKIGALGMDVYEEEADLFFEDMSSSVITDDVFARLQTFPNVLITGHQAFFTREALTKIAEVTLGNLDQLESSGQCDNSVPLN